MTFAGLQEPTGVTDGMGSTARFAYPRGVATDNMGNIYVADLVNGTIRKITPAGAVTTLAGLAGNRESCDGTGSEARFTAPSGVATDSSGNVYVADITNSAIRKITPSGVVTTLAGLAGSVGSADGTGTAARFSSPVGVTTDRSGNIYVADRNNYAIRKITPAGEVTTLAGLAGSRGSADGTGSVARFYYPEGVAADGGGNVYVADTSNHTIRKITPAGVVTTLAGLAENRGNADGTGSAARFSDPAGLAIDSSGNIYVAAGHTIRKITAAGEVTTLAGLAGATGTGSADGIGSAARFYNPSGVATDGNENIYVADTFNYTIRKITAAGEVTTLAGLAGFGQSADGTGTEARFYLPYGVAVGSSGNVYVADSNNETIRKITPAGEVTTLAGVAGSSGSADGPGSAARFAFPLGVATDTSENIYVADSNNATIRKITPAGVVTTLAGRAGSFGSADGTGSAARFSGPVGVGVDNSGTVYVADKNNATIRKITPTGAVTTLAGRAGAPGNADGIGSAARFFEPYGVAIDSTGNVYVADFGNSAIRKVTPIGAVTTITDATLIHASPAGVAIDSSGNVYVAGAGSHTLLKITPAGAVKTLAGLADTPKGSADGMGSAARFSLPFAVAVDSSGNVYVADTDNHSIRVGKPVLADVATIDISSGLVGAARQLGTSPQTAGAWQWSVIRRPVDAVADLSSTTVRNPTFTPDVPGLFRFRLIATGGAATSITTVDFTSLAQGGGRRRAVRR